MIGMENVYDDFLLIYMICVIVCQLIFAYRPFAFLPIWVLAYCTTPIFPNASFGSI